MQKGDIVLIPFPFTDLTGNKLRPAIVLIETTFDFTVCFITTQLAWRDSTDMLIYPNPDNGIKKTSLLRISKLATIDKSLSLGKIGCLSNSELENLNDKLKELLQIN